MAFCTDCLRKHLGADFRLPQLWGAKGVPTAPTSATLPLPTPRAGSRYFPAFQAFVRSCLK